MLHYRSERPRWQAAVEWTAAVALAALWLAAGLWKLSDVTATQVRMTQALAPAWLSLPAALGVGGAEVFAAILLLAPAWRRWGAWLSAILLLFFMGYIGYHYRALTGAECSCFPWLKRAVGPLFFVEDALLIVLAAAAGWWAQPPRGIRRAAAALALVALLAGGLLAWDRRRGDEPLPIASITVDGRPLDLRGGRFLLFFFNPYCPHCLQTAQALSRLKWNAAVIGLATQDFEQGPGFFQDAGWKGVRLSPDGPRLRQILPFPDVPYAVAIVDGQIREKLHFFEEPKLSGTLRKLGLVAGSP